jgi:hypothetical protein
MVNVSGFSLTGQIIDSLNFTSPNGPHVENQKELVRWLFTDARSFPDLSIPVKY